MRRGRDDDVRVADGRWLARPYSPLEWAVARMRGNAGVLADAINAEDALPWRERLQLRQQRRKQLRQQRQRKKAMEEKVKKRDAKPADPDSDDLGDDD